jgi:crotonobetaine/carnitine-CoA ligase
MQADPHTHHGVLEAQAAQFGEAPFLHFKDEVYSFAELDRRAAHVAAGLQKLGIRKGDTVALMLGNRPEFMFTWFGIAKAGAVMVPINVAHRGPVLRHMLGIAKCRAIVADPTFLPQVTTELPNLPELASIIVVGSLPPASITSAKAMTFDELTNNKGDYQRQAIKPRDPGIINFTSGTTGPSKGAVKPHGEAVETAAMTVSAANYGPQDCVYIPLPMFHGNALVMGCFAALKAGARLVITERFSATQFWPDIARHKCTSTNYIGGMLAILMKADPKPDDADNTLTRMFGAGAPGAIFEAFEQRFGVTLVEGYGMSEMGVPFLGLPGARKPGTCGRVQPGYDVCLIDDEGNDVPDDVPGELLVRPNMKNFMMLEYIGMPEKTVEAWRDLWFHTGDVLKRDADGFYKFVDRKKDAIRRRGENISSFEVEHSVLTHPTVLECAAFAVPSELSEDEVMICVVPKAGQSVEVTELHGFLTRNMAAFMVPRYIRVMAAMPKTATERVEKYKLREEGITADTWDAVKAGAAPAARRMG